MIATHAESLSDINEAISRSLDALDINQSVKDINAPEVERGIIDTLVLLQRLRRATLERVERESPAP